MLESALETPRLRLLLESTETVLARIEALSPEDRAEVSAGWLERVRAAPPSPWTHGFSIIERSSDCSIGGCAFKGPPDDQDSVEIAYQIDPGYRGLGYAKEAAMALIGIAAELGAKEVRAHTLPKFGPSTSVLTACGFQKIGEVVDLEDGLVWRWQRKASPEQTVTRNGLA